MRPGEVAVPGGWLSVESSSIRQQLRLQQQGRSAFNWRRCESVAVICSQLFLGAKTNDLHRLRRSARCNSACRRPVISYLYTVAG